MHVTDATTIVILSCFGLLTSTSYVSADGAIGCLFSKTLCKPKNEWCYNDFAFGKCVSLYEGDAEVDLYQYDLNEDSYYLLKRELEKLIKLGYRWSHFYTQCVLKALLFAFRYQKEYDASACEALSEEDPSLTYFRQNLEVDPKSLGQVQFTPSMVNPHAEYADEIYIPEFGKGDTIEETIVPLPNMKLEPSENYVNDIRRALLLSQINKNKRSKGNSIDLYEVDELENEFPADYAFYLNELAREDAQRNYPFAGYVEPIKAKIHFTETYNTPDHFRAGLESRDYDKDVDLSISESVYDNDGNILKSFSQNYNTPEKFRNGQETKDDVFYPERPNEVIYLNQPDGYLYPDGQRQLVYDQYGSVESSAEAEKNSQNNDGVFTEGGIVYLRDEGKESSDSNSLEELVNTYDNWGFKRPERLDVKKPGPSFSTNNYAFQTEKQNSKEKMNDVKEPINKNLPVQQDEPQSTEISKVEENLKIQPEKKKGGSPMESPSLRKITTTVQPVKEKEGGIDEGGASDGEFAYITLRNRINTWQEGSRIIRKIENVLRLSQNTFSEIRVSQNELKFKVERNRSNLNASEVAKRINANKDAIQRLSGVEIVSVQVGNQTSLPSSTNLLNGDERQLWMLSFLLCGVIAAVAIAGTAFFVIRRHSHHKEKIKNIAPLDSEASKDYQELCRARMAVKAVQEKPEGNVTAHRITNIVKETEGSNHSSRSSTSSWSEEPALTNMDISTGHMVLSYMEDHLKNKDRLEQEWIALCAYEAEPSATTVATKGENSKKNRYADVLPYDHARVILNELSNISGSDYINASTITDHDPRNPAYIVTQGALENTAADFWQMVWEQGSVVMVMLTRLTENGNNLCHRYWPEEGSELYHIYEVHLVSEHIWCDDYLVRSFYLKNIKTGETRTVTQFHFLSWPENGIPLSTKALLEFRRKVNKSYRGRSCPIVVHCSDGAGRSGTYCLIDMVLNRMSKGAKEIDIAATLEHIRDQRALMVRTKQQFEFVLMAVAEEVHAILKALPANPNHSPPPVVKEKDFKYGSP